jgi:hypothetical protein
MSCENRKFDCPCVEGCGMRWFENVQRCGHRDPTIAIKATFTCTGGEKVKEFIREHCPGKDALKAERKIR